MRYYFIYILIFLQSICLILKAESSDSLSLNYPYINYTTKDGLPSNETYCILQDSKGYIWIGTDRGLVKYDGYEFKTYTTLDGLNDNVILAINEDDDGNIWYTGLNTLELGYITPEMNFLSYRYNQEIIDTISNLLYSKLYFNDLYIKNENIYLVNRRFGFIKLSPKGIINVYLKFNGISTFESNLYVKKDSNVQFVYANLVEYTFNSGYLNIFNSKEEGIFKYKKNQFREIFPTIINGNSEQCIYDGSDLITLKDSLVQHIQLPYLCSAFQLDSNTYIYSTYGVNGGNAKVFYSNSPDINDYKIQLFKNSVRIIKVIHDNNSGVWMATSKGGIFYFPSFDTKSYSLKKPIETIFPSDTGLFLSNREYEYIYNYNDQKLISTTSDFCYSDLSHRKYNFSFFGHIGMDLKYSNLRSHLTDVTSISGIHIMSDSLLYLWNLGQLFKVKHNEIDYDFFWEFSDNYKWKDVIDKKFFMETVYCLKEDSCLIGLKNGMYLFSRDSIINLHKEEGKRIRRIEYFKKSNVLAYCIWGEGLVLEFNNGKQLRLSEKDGLASNTINTTFMDDNEVLWLGTNKGINSLQVDTLTDEYHISTISNGSKNLSSPNVLQIYNRDSNLYLGTDSGFDIIDLRVDGKMAEIPLVLDSLYINESYYKPTNDFISLRYDSNTFTFYYTAIAFNKFGDLKYRYKLEGLSNNWVYTKERKTTFIQLNPGEYTFHLQVQNEQGKWINLGLKPHFNIKPPYWTTWWFIGGGVLLSLLLIGGILFYYIRNIRKEKTFIEQEKHLLEELNESQQKALSSQLNPHFVFNSLNSIQNFILTKRTELSSDYLSMFSKLMRFVFENSKKLYVPLSDEIEALELYLELEEVRHNHKFSYQIKDNTLETEEIQIPALLVQPIIENAIWHGLLHKKSEDRLLEIKFYVDDMSLHIDVKDNGVGRGFSKPRPKFIKKQRSSGVQLTKQRLELLSQSSNLDTNFKIIDLSDKIGRPCGTCVTISIPSTLNSIDK